MTVEETVRQFLFDHLVAGEYLENIIPLVKSDVPKGTLSP